MRVASATDAGSAFNSSRNNEIVLVAVPNSSADVCCGMCCCQCVALPSTTSRGLGD